MPSGTTEHRYDPQSPALAIASGFSHTLRSGGDGGAWWPLSTSAGFQGGWTALVSGFTPFIWLWNQHTQLHCLGECGRWKDGWELHGPSNPKVHTQASSWAGLNECYGLFCPPRLSPVAGIPQSCYLLGHPIHHQLILQTLSHLPKCLQLARNRLYPSLRAHLLTHCNT